MWNATERLLNIFPCVVFEIDPMLVSPLTMAGLSRPSRKIVDCFLSLLCLRLSPSLLLCLRLSLSSSVYASLLLCLRLSLLLCLCLSPPLSTPLSLSSSVYASLSSSVYASLSSSVYASYASLSSLYASFSFSLYASLLQAIDGLMFFGLYALRQRLKFLNT